MKIAAIGTGSIVETFLEAVKTIDGIECAGLYSRKRENGQALADKFGIPRVYSDPDEMYDDPQIDFVYVASPNSLHYSYARQALLRGKNVIGEKPFTSTLEETDELISLAHEKKLFLFEAITTIHCPNYISMKNHLPEIGKIGLIRSSFCQYSRRCDAFRRGELPNVFNPEFSGGALMDLNVYNLHFVMGLLGMPQKVHYHSRRHENGIDLAGVLVLEYPETLCECVAAKDVHALNGAQIHGDKGYIHIPGSVSGCHAFTVSVQESERTYNVQKTTNNLYHELVVFKELYEARDLGRCHDLLAHTRDVMEVLAEARRKSGIVFAADAKKRKS